MARIESTTITTQTSTLVYSANSRPENNTPELVRMYVIGTFNGATATLFSSPDGGTTKIAEKDRLGNAIAFTQSGYFDINVVSRVSNPPSEKPIQYYLTTTAANPTGIKAITFDMN